jgi:hypothetical protein
MENRAWPTWLIVLLLALSLACNLTGTRSQETTAPPQTNETLASPTPPPRTTTERGSCLDLIPVYPDVRAEPQIEGDLEALVEQMQALGAALEGAVAAYRTADSPTQVLTFYEERSPQGDWTRTIDVTTAQGGIIVWERDDDSAQAFVAVDDTETVVVLGCGKKLGAGSEAAPAATAAPSEEVVPPLDISPDQLALTTFTVRPAERAGVGQSVEVIFTLRNVAQEAITFEAPGVFVGCRWNATGDDNNCDFGHQFADLTLEPGQAVTLQATRQLDQAGTWRFWPAYSTAGHWGPFRWYEWMIETDGG